MIATTEQPMTEELNALQLKELNRQLDAQPFKSKYVSTGSGFMEVTQILESRIPSIVKSEFAANRIQRPYGREYRKKTGKNFGKRNPF